MQLQIKFTWETAFSLVCSLFRLYRERKLNLYLCRLLLSLWLVNAKMFRLRYGRKTHSGWRTIFRSICRRMRRRQAAIQRRQRPRQTDCYVIPLYNFISIIFTCYQIHWIGLEPCYGAMRTGQSGGGRKHTAWNMEHAVQPGNGLVDAIRKVESHKFNQEII